MNVLHTHQAGVETLCIKLCLLIISTDAFAAGPLHHWFLATFNASTSKLNYLENTLLARTYSSPAHPRPTG